MGRPKLDKLEKREHRVGACFTLDEWNTLVARAEKRGLTLTEYVRKAALTAPVLKVPRNAE